MNDLISRQAAIDVLKNRWKKTRNYEGIGDDIAEECELYLKQVPSAQPERKRGEWEEIEVIADAYDISGVKTWASKMKCDQCGFTTIAIEGRFSQYNFCPNCGADMRNEVTT